MPPEEEVSTEDVEEEVASTETAEETAEESEPEVLLEGLDLGDTEEAPAQEKQPVSDTDKRLKTLEENYQKASTHIEDLNKALSQARIINQRLRKEMEGGKKKEGADEFLTDDQAKSILEEHGNDWDTVFRVMNHQAAKAAAKARGEVVNELETKQTLERINAYLQQEWPDVLNEDSAIANDVQTTMDKLGIAANPFGRFLAGGAMLMTNWKKILADKEAAIRKEVLGEKAESARKEVVKKTGLTAKTASDKRGTPGVSLPANLEDRAKQMGMTKRQKEIYARLVKGGNLSAQVGA